MSDIIATRLYDIFDVNFVAELLVYEIDAREFMARDPARYVTELTAGQTLDPARSGVRNRQIIRNP